MLFLYSTEETTVAKFLVEMGSVLIEMLPQSVPDEIQKESIENIKTEKLEDSGKLVLKS